MEIKSIQIISKRRNGCESTYNIEIKNQRILILLLLNFEMPTIALWAY